MKPAPKEPKANSHIKRKKSQVKGSRLEAFNFQSIVGSGAFGKVFKVCCCYSCFLLNEYRLNL